MGRISCRRLKNAAGESVKKGCCNPRKLVAIHTGVMLAISLAVLAIDFLLEQQIENTGGLSGMGTRSVLTTVQAILRQAQVIALPFWQIGWLYVTVKIARGEAADKTDLTEGFRRFFPFLRLTILKGVMFFGLALVATYAASFVVLLTPFATPVLEYVANNMQTITEAELMAQMEVLTVPTAIIAVVLSLVAIAPFFYRFRMAEFIMLDYQKIRARGAMRVSWRMMRGRMWQMMGLDLSFWWFWLLTILASALGWADVLLPAVGITLPLSADVCYFAAFLLAALAQLMLHYFAKAKMDVTYAHAYMELLPKEGNAHESH